MADYKIALTELSIVEGKYANNIHDSGGETYRGVSRNNWPSWPGWAIVDRKRGDPNFPDNLDSDKVLQSWVENFYQINFWNQVRGNDLPDQELANQLLNIAVNIGNGIHRASLWLQQSLNMLNNRQLRWPDIDEDGAIGGVTLGTLNKAIKAGYIKEIMASVRIMQGNFYQQLVKNKLDQEIFYVSWLRRVGLIK
jgi:lysozyme family protein